MIKPVHVLTLVDFALFDQATSMAVAVPVFGKADASAATQFRPAPIGAAPLDRLNR